MFLIAAMGRPASAPALKSFNSSGFSMAIFCCAEDEGGPGAAADQLEGLLGEARSLLQEHHQAYLKYQGLSPNHRFRK